MVWLDVLPGDSRRLVDTRVLNDARATNYYDAHRVIGPWFSKNVDHEPGLAWDTYYLYGPAADWSAEPSPLLSSGRPVIGSARDLADAFSKLG